MLPPDHDRFMPISMLWRLSVPGTAWQDASKIDVGDAPISRMAPKGCRLPPPVQPCHNYVVVTEAGYALVSSEVRGHAKLNPG